MSELSVLMTVEGVSEVPTEDFVATVAKVSDPDLLTELKTLEETGLNRVEVVQAIDARLAELADEEAPVEALPEEVTWADAPMSEVLPIVREGYWARIKSTARNVPKTVLGRDVVVVGAPILVGGPDTHSSGRYEYQPNETVFAVVPADGGEQFECTRAAFAAFGPNQIDVQV